MARFCPADFIASRAEFRALYDETKFGAQFGLDQKLWPFEFSDFRRFSRVLPPIRENLARPSRSPQDLLPPIERVSGPPQHAEQESGPFGRLFRTLKIGPIVSAVVSMATRVPTRFPVLSWNGRKNPQVNLQWSDSTGENGFWTGLTKLSDSKKVSGIKD